MSAQYSALENFGAGEPWVRNLVVAALSRRAASIANSGEPLSSVPPSAPGECTTTRIKEITTRFGEPISYDNEDSGTSIQYASGNYGVTYGRDPVFYSERAGQEVVQCLMSIPYDCPDNDDRGRIYYTYDPSTKGEWELPDAQHMCGGA